VIEGWDVERVEVIALPDRHIQRVVLKSGQVIKRTMKRIGRGSFRSTKPASVFERHFSDEGNDVLDSMFDFACSDVCNWIWGEDGPDAA